MIRKLAVLALGCAALVAAPRPAMSADEAAGLFFYEKAAKDVLRAAAEKVWGTADDARKQGFHALCEEQAERALEFDPDHKDARDHLKYERKEGKWVRNEEDWKRAPHQNVKSENEAQENFDKRVKKWQDESLAKTDKYVAAKYAELGDMCASKGYPEQATKGYEAAMRLDKENEKARRGLGYTKFGKVWLTKKQDEARKAASKPVEIKDPEKTQWEELFNVKLNKMESAHVRIESPFPIEEISEHIKAAETAYAYYLADFARDPGEDVFSGGKSTFIIMSTDDQWNLFIDKFGGNDKEFTRKLMGCGIGELSRGIRGGVATKDVKKKDGGTETQIGSTPESRRDMLVHGIVHQLNRRVWRLEERAWLDEGLTYYYTLKTLETCLTHCVARKVTDYADGRGEEGGYKKWDNPDGWKPLLKALVAKKNDTPLRSVTMLPITKLDFIDTVKSWSVASWLMDLDRAKFMSVLDQMLDRAVKQENVIQGTYGKGLEEIDEDWKKYVKKCY
jgi:hypothetical protein